MNPRTLTAAVLCALLVVLALGPVARAADEIAVTVPLRLELVSLPTVGAGSQITISYTMSAPNQQASFVYVNEDSLAQVTIWAGASLDPGPYSSPVSVSVDQSDFRWSGHYKLVSVDLLLPYGKGSVRYARDGSILYLSPGLEPPTQRPGRLDLADFTVNNPAFVLPDNPNTRIPEISGTPVYDGVLSADSGSWTLTPDSVDYQWLRNGQPIPYDSNPDHRVVEADLGQQVSVRVTARLADHKAVSSTSMPVMPTSPISATPSSLQGKLTVGETLTGSFDESSISVSPEAATTTVRYEWARGSTVIPEATGKTYTLQHADRGAIIAFRAIVHASLQTAVERPFTALSRSIVRDKAHTAGFDAGTTMDLFARDAAANLMLYPTDGAGHWQSPRTIGVGWDVFNTVFSAGDFDGDGSNDVIGRDAAGSLFLYPGNGTGGWLPRKQIGWRWDVFDAVIAVGDFTGDGIQDLLARTPSGALLVYPGDGSGGLRSGGTIGQGWDVMDAVFAPGDFDGDGNPDVLARDRSGYLHFYGGNGLGGWTTSRVIGQGWGVMTRIGGAGDFDGDGFNDVWAVDSSGQLNMYYGNGSGGWKGAGVVGWVWGGFSAVF